MEFEDMKKLAELGVCQERETREWKAGEEQRNEKRLQELKMHLANVHAAFVRQEKEVEALKKVQETTQEEPEFVKYVCSTRRKDQPEFDKLNELLVRADEQDVNALKEYVVRTFLSVFKGMRSRTTVVGKAGSEEITISKYGFGLRHNVQSKRVKRFYEVEKIMEQKDVVVASLKRLKLDGWARKLETFVKCVPNVDALEGDMKIKLPGTIMLPQEWRDDRPSLCSNVTVEQDCISVGNYCDLHFERGRNEGFTNQKWLLMYVEFRPYLTFVVETAEERLQPIIESVQKMKADLQDNFGKELLLSDI